MGSDESHFNVSVGSDGRSHKSVHKPQPFWRERRAETVSNRGPSAYQPNGTVYLRAAVQRRGQRPPKGSGTNMTVEAT